MLSHGIHSPLCQAGAITPFEAQAGTAAGLSGAFFMVVAFAIGTVVGVSYNETLYPIAIIAFTNSAIAFICVRVFPDLRVPSSSSSE